MRQGPGKGVAGHRRVTAPAGACKGGWEQEALAATVTLSRSMALQLDGAPGHGADLTKL